MSSIEQTYADRGYEVRRDEGGVVLEVPNPDPTADSYFHGDNPHTVGFGSRGPEAERAGTDMTVEPGQSTAEALGDEGGFRGGENVTESAGHPGDAQTVQGGGQQTGGEQQGGSEPDESWRNDDLRAYADENDIDVPSNATKAELLEAIREQSADG